MLSALLLAFLLIIPAVTVLGQSVLPPYLWGEPDQREDMRATASRWHDYEQTPLPPQDIATHGPAVPAFPGAEGFGAYSFGGRGGKLYRVTNLNDSGPGSFRAAVEAEGPRTVIFDVSGTIHLKSGIQIYNPYLTIAGQTAPGEGITITGYKVQVRTYDVIVRHMRFRRSDVNLPDEWTFRVMGGNHVIVDHVTVSWGIDGNLGVTQMDNVTIQNSVLSKPLWGSFHPKGIRGYGALVRGQNGGKYSFIRNLWANHRARVPRPGNYLSHTADPNGLLMDFRNNVIFMGVGANYDEDSVTKYNYVNNYILTDWRMIEESSHSQGYFSGNYRGGSLVQDHWGTLLHAGGRVNRSYHDQSEPFETADVTTLTAPEAWETVMANAGNWKRDIHDELVIQEVINYHRTNIEGGTEEYELPEWWKTGSIDSQTEVGGLPDLPQVVVPLWIDTNRNGIPDWWEQEKGLDTSDPDIANKDSNGNGYTNLEDYLNDLDAIRKTHDMIPVLGDAKCFEAGPHVRQTDASTAMVTWVTPNGVSAGQVQLQPASGGPETSVTAEITVPGFQSRGFTDLEHVQHRAVFEDLDPDTEYDYTVQCGDGETASSGTFRTSLQAGESSEFSFAIIADAHAERGMHEELAGALAAENPAFIVHIGGFIGGDGIDWEMWRHYFHAAKPYLESSLIWPVPGSNDATPARNFRGLFGFNNPQGTDPSEEDNIKTWYRFTHGNTEFFVFDLSGDLDTQKEWAQWYMPRSNAEWMIAIFHYPDPGIGGSGQLFQDNMLEFAMLFEQYGVDLVVSGGNHIYERLFPIGPEGEKPVNYVNVTSGSDFRAVRPSPIVIGGIALEEHVYAHFHVDGNNLLMEARTADGRVVDQLELIKNGDGLFQDEIMDLAIDRALAAQIGHIFTGQNIFEDIRFERRDLRGEFTSIPQQGGSEANLRLNVSRIPIGSELIIHEQVDVAGWRISEQIIEINDDVIDIPLLTPDNLSLDTGGIEPSPALNMHFRMDEREYPAVVLKPTMEGFLVMSQPELRHPRRMALNVSPNTEFHFYVTHAAQYQFQITESGFYDIKLDTVVTDTEIRLPFVLKEGQRHRWRVRGISIFGSDGPWSEEWVFTTGTATDAETFTELPLSFALGDNYPNPFNPSTNIHYELPEVAHVTLRVFDVIGREVAVLVSEEQQPGHHQVVFDSGRMASGVYLYRLEAVSLTGSGAGRFIQTKKMILVK